MGLFSFAKSLGKKIFDGGNPEEKALKKELDDLGLNTKGVDISIDGDKVVIGGEAVDQATKEKIILAAGNLEGVSSVEDKASVKGGASDIVFYEVKKGDNLWKIAEATLGNGADYMKIFEANKPMLKDPDLIYPGQVLRIEK